jgi:hypothetical protein
VKGTNAVQPTRRCVGAAPGARICNQVVSCALGQGLHLRCIVRPTRRSVGAAPGASICDQVVHVHWVRVCICVASSGPPGDVWVQHQAQASEMKSFMCIGSGSLLFLSLFICDQVASCVFGQGLHMRCILCNLVRVRIRKIYDAGSCRDCY